jgi:hypothetical protein
MAKFIITEKQMDFIKRNLLIEAVGVPEGIIEVAETLYDVVLGLSKKMNKDSEQNFNTNIDLKISDVHIKHLELTIKVEEEEWYDSDFEVSRFGVITDFKFDENLLLKVNDKNDSIVMIMDFISKDDEWSPQDVSKLLEKDKIHFISIFAHELKHKFDKQKKITDLIKRDIDYHAVSSAGLNFGIPVIQQFLRNSYLIHGTENLVRPTEIATRMKLKNIKKEEFVDFLKNDKVFQDLNNIRNFSYDYLVERLKNEMDYVDRLLDHIEYDDYEKLSPEEKIKVVLELVYINLANTKSESFDLMTRKRPEGLEGFLKHLGITQPKKRSKELERFRDKFISQLAKYEDREIDFFKDECERFNYDTTKLIKKISKIYSLIENKDTTNESILDWGLHEKIMEKKYGKRKIDTEYNFKKR